MAISTRWSRCSTALRRLSRPEGMAGVMVELERLYEPLLADFREFYPQLQAFAAVGRMSDS